MLKHRMPKKSKLDKRDPEEAVPKWKILLAFRFLGVEFPTEESLEHSNNTTGYST
jgi:hypothetical protein